MPSGNVDPEAVLLGQRRHDGLVADSNEYFVFIQSGAPNLTIPRDSESGVSSVVIAVEIFVGRNGDARLP